MTDMIERVARALCGRAGLSADAVVTPMVPWAARHGRWFQFAGFSPQPQPAWRWFEDDARAAIAAMREPTYWIPMTDAALEPLNAETPRPGSLGAEDMGPRFSENIDPKPDWRTAAAMLAEGDAMIDAAIERAAKPPNGPARRDPAT